MTDDQRHIIQGRARDEAKGLIAELATLKTFFDKYSENLQSVQTAITQFLADPTSRVIDNRPWFDYLNSCQQKLCEPGFFEYTAEFADKTAKLRKLEKQIKDF
jgi:hypothetical protein